MKFMKPLMASLLSVAMFTACSKDDNVEAPAFSAAGKWEGKLIDGSNGASAFYGIQLNANGSLTRYKSTGELLATGHYQVMGDSIKANYEFLSGSTYSIAGAINKAAGTMSGTWGSGSKTSGLGTWNASKKN